MRVATLVLVLALGMGTLGSCSTKDKVTDGDRMLTDQNRQAGAFIVKLGNTMAAVGVPANVQAGLVQIMAAATDVNLNSAQQLKNWGPPAKPVPYSTAASAASRQQSEEEHKLSTLQVVLGGLGTLALGFFGRGGFGRVLGAVAPALAGGPLGVGLTAVVEGIARLRRNIREKPAGQRHFTEADLMKELERAQKNPTAQKLIQTLARKVEKKLGVSLSGVLPNAPTTS